MPGFLLHLGAMINCAHKPGLAQPMAPYARVMVMKQPIVLQTTAYVVAGCALTGSPNPPCATAQWLSGATRVKANGVPVLLEDSQSTCVPTATPLSVATTQKKVKGQ